MMPPGFDRFQGILTLSCLSAPFNVVIRRVKHHCLRNERVTGFEPISYLLDIHQDRHKRAVSSW